MSKSERVAGLVRTSHIKTYYSYSSDQPGNTLECWQWGSGRRPAPSQTNCTPPHQQNWDCSVICLCLQTLPKALLSWEYYISYLVCFRRIEFMISMHSDWDETYKSGDHLVEDIDMNNSKGLSLPKKHFLFSSICVLMASVFTVHLVELHQGYFF